MRAPDLKPVLAIVGRPNVGKSALFNRIAGRRLAIVHEEDGVTRDRLAVDAQWAERAFRLVDTGGIGVMDGAESGDGIESAVRGQALAAVKEADVMIQVVDTQAGLTPLDIEVGRILRTSGRPVLVAANKADNDLLSDQAVEFAELGRDVFPVSAVHNRGIGDLMDAAAEALPEAETEIGAEPGAEAPLRIVVLGRPNAGKSSFINALLGEDRVIVSAVPGTTRDSIEVPFTIGAGENARAYLLCDTAGLRRRGKFREAVEHYSHLRVEHAVRRADIAALLFDATSGPSRQDKRISALIQSEHKGCILMVNKWDLAAGTKQAQYAKAVREALPFLTYAPLVFLSAKTGYRVRATIGAIDRAAAAYAQTVTTGLLNRVLREAFERTHPPVVQGRPLKFFYATQVGTRPPRFRLFVNDPNRLVDAYRAYLEGRLRKAFGFEGAPVVLSFAGRKR